MYKLAIAIGAVSAAAVVILAGIVLRLRPLVWLSLRGPRRRPTESILAALGIALGASLTVGALVLADSVEMAVADLKATRLGPVDIAISFEGNDVAAQVAQMQSAIPPGSVQATMTVDQLSASLGVPAEDPDAAPVRAEPDIWLMDVDFNKAEEFGASGDSGLPATGPSSNGVYVSSALADALSVREGDEVLVGLPRSRHRFRVERLLEARSLAGYGSGLDKPPRTVWVPQGWLASQRPVTQLLIAVAPGEGSLDYRSQALLKELAPTATSMRAPKPTASKVGAEVELTSMSLGALMRRQLLQLGSFAGAASLALVVAVFVMMVADRRREIGILRASGMKRLDVGAEMGQEAIGLGLAGVAAGIGLGLLVAAAAAGVSEATINAVLGGVTFRVNAKPESLVIGAGAAFLAGILAALAATRRWVSMAPASALRSTEEVGRPVRLGHLIAGVVAMAFGIATAATDLKYKTATFSYLGPPIAVAGLAAVLYQTQWAYIGMLVAAIASCVWLIGIDIQWGGQAAAEGVFVLFGMALALIASASVAFGVLSPLVARGATKLMNSLSANAVTMRLAAGNLAASRGQAGFAVATCALVVLMPASISTVSSLERADRARMLWNQAGGWTASLESRAADSSESSFAEKTLSGPTGGQFQTIVELPVARSSVHLVGGGAVASSLYATSPELATAQLEPGGNNTGAMLPLVSREAGLDDDADAWRALFEENSENVPRVIVTAGLLPSGIALPGAPVRIGESGRQARIAGVAHRNAFLPGVFMAPETMSEIGIPVDRRHALAIVAAGADPDALALAFQGEYFGDGARMVVAASTVESQLRPRTLLARLLQSFLSIGLAVGMASLGVLMARSVRSRRHEIAILRSLGVSRLGVSLSVVGQSLGLSVVGVGMGVVVGGYVGGRIFLAMSAGGSAAIPWGSLFAVFAAVVVVVSIGAVIPAILAGRLPPAEALRQAED